MKPLSRLIEISLLLNLMVVYNGNDGLRLVLKEPGRLKERMNVDEVDKVCCHIHSASD